MLNEELDRILSARQADPDGPAGARFETVFTIPHQVVSAAIQPSLAGYNPRLRSRAWFRITGGFMERYAANPEQYQSQDAVVSIFEEYR